MNTTKHIRHGIAMILTRFAALRGAIAAVVATALLCAAGTANAALRTYVARWSGVPYGNNAQATAVIVIDDTLLRNPGLNHNFFGDPSSAITSINIRVSGASSGDGTWTTGDFGDFVLSIDTALDLDADWVGQAQPSDGIPWGSPGAVFHDFNIFSKPASGAPIGVAPYQLRTNRGAGDEMGLTSFAPGPAGELAVGRETTNFPGVTIKTLYPAATAPDGTLYLHAKLAGSGINSANDECILSWGGDGALVLAQEGDIAGSTGLPIKSFGDPVFHPDGALNVSAKLGGGATKTDDDVLLLVPLAGGANTVLFREGDSVSVPAGFSIKKLEWIHPANNEDVFVGVQLTDSAGEVKPKALLSVQQGTLAFVGGPVQVNDHVSIIKSISKPVQKSPANYVGRVGNLNSISVLIKTTTPGETVIKQFFTVPLPD